jgi:hypothetical protein
VYDRVVQVVWVLDYLDDLESDFSVFHRVDDIYSMPGPRFFRLAIRLPKYKGVLQMRLMEEYEQAHPTPTEGIAQAPSSGSAGKAQTGWQTMSLEEADAQRNVPAHLRGERREVRREL